MKVGIGLSPAFDLSSWSILHARGEVPGAIPYGLEHLERFQLELVRPTRAGSLIGRIEKGLAKTTGYSWGPAARLVNDSSSDIVLCWDERIGVPANALAHVLPRARPAVSGVIWLTDGMSRGWKRALSGAALRSARRVFALSSAQLPVLHEQWSIPRRRLRHVLFGVDAKFFSAGRSDPESLLVLGAGNDVHRDHPLLISAVLSARRRIPGVRCELITRAPIEVPPELGVRRVSVSNQEMRTHYQRAQVVAVALRPNLHVSGISVLLEAMACGCPVVATDTPGMRDYVDDGTTGLLVPPGDQQRFAEALTSLLSDPDQCREMGLRAREQVELRFNTVAQAGMLADLLREAAGDG